MNSPDVNYIFVTGWARMQTKRVSTASRNTCPHCVQQIKHLFKRNNISKSGVPQVLWRTWQLALNGFLKQKQRTWATIFQGNKVKKLSIGKSHHIQRISIRLPVPTNSTPEDIGESLSIECISEVHDQWLCQHK